MNFLYCLFMLVVVFFLMNSIIKDKNVKKIMTIIIFIILCLVSGTRYNTGGTDYYVYKNIFNFLPTNINFFDGIKILQNKFEIEYGFSFYISIIKKIGFNYYGFTLINSIIFYTIFYKILKRYDYNIFLILILFLYKFFFYNTFISLRQPLAILIFWLALPYLKEKKYLKYYLFCFLALMFHRSAIIIFFIPFITNTRITKQTYAVIMIICLFLYVFDIGSMLNFSGILKVIFSNDAGAISRIDAYSNSSYGMNVFYLLEYYLIAILVYMKYNSIYQYDNNSELFLKLFICLVPFYTIFANYSIVTRFKDFFFLAYPIMIYCIAKTQKRSAIIIYILTIFISFYGYWRYLNNFDNGGLLDYDSYLFKNIPIFIQKNN